MKKIFILILVHSCSWLIYSYRFTFNAKPSQLRFSRYNYYSFIFTGHFLKRLTTVCLGSWSNHLRVLSG